MKRAVVIASHRAPDRPPVRVEPGDSEWPQFVWTSLTTGLGGWMPAILFDRDEGEATATQPYDTRELDADEGESLLLHHELAGWWWAENTQGTGGWIPTRVLRILEDSQSPAGC